MIPFNRIFHTENELTYIGDALKSGKISGDGPYTQLCEHFFEEKYGFKRALLTSSCTTSLEMCAMLLDLRRGDEVIMPSYGFVSIANAFIIHGANVVFADSEKNSPNIDANAIEELITPRTKAIVAIHYGGVACQIDKIKNIATRHNIHLIEDAAHSIDARYHGKPLGSFGELATFSFHETKNITCGEGGMLVINNEQFSKRAEVMREKGTNHSAFTRNEISRYDWVDIGASFLASDMSAAHLYAQLSALDEIQQKRKDIWNRYFNNLKPLADKGMIDLPHVPEGAEHSAHIFFIVCRSAATRSKYIQFMVEQGIKVQFHYLTLHNSPYFRSSHDGRALPNAKRFEECLVRLPLFADLTVEDVGNIIDTTKQFFCNHNG